MVLKFVALWAAQILFWANQSLVTSPWLNNIWTDGLRHSLLGHTAGLAPLPASSAWIFGRTNPCLGLKMGLAGVFGSLCQALAGGLEDYFFLVSSALTLFFNDRLRNLGNWDHFNKAKLRCGIIRKHDIKGYCFFLSQERMYHNRKKREREKECTKLSYEKALELNPYLFFRTMFF